MSQEVRLAVERALAKLIGRFGSHSDVIGELRHALKLMEREEVPASSNTTSGEPVTGSSGDGGIEVGTETTTEAEPRPKARKRTGRKK